MSRHRFALSTVFRAVRKHWRPILLGASMVLLLALVCFLYLLDAERGERAAIFIGGTLVGMICIALLVYRR